MRVVDANVAIDLLRGRGSAVTLFEQLLGSGEPVVGSEITRFEVLAGLRSGEEEETERFFARLVWVPVDEVIARRAAALVRRYRPAHSGIEDEDYFVAATALALEAELLTTNVRHFPMLSGLEPAY